MTIPYLEKGSANPTCGGYAWQMNERPEAQPHMDWCPQRDEYAEWFKWKEYDARNNTGTTGF